MPRVVLKWILWVMASLLLAGWLTLALLPAVVQFAGAESLEPTLARKLHDAAQPTFILLAVVFAVAVEGFTLKPRVYLASLLSAVLLWVCYFPLNWWGVSFFALAPFLLLVRAEGVGRWRRYTAAWVGGVAFGSLAVNWLRAAHPMMAVFAWPGLSLWMSLWYPFALFLLRRLDRLGRPPLALTLPVVWVALEYAKAHWPTGYPFMRWVHLHQPSGFAWYFLGHTQHANIPLLQSADLGGAYLITAAVAAVNGAVYDWLVRIRPVCWLFSLPRGWRPGIYRAEFMATAGALLVLGGLVVYGSFRLLHPPFDAGPTVALLQDDLSHARTQFDAPLVFSRYDQRCRDAARGDPDLIVWPECCYPFADVTVKGANPPADWEGWFHYAVQEGALKVNDLTPEARTRQETAAFRQLMTTGRKEHAAANWHTHVLLGCTALDWDGTTDTKHNSALLLRPDGTPGPRYDKTHLVPFGEYIPFRQQLPFLSVFSPTPNEAGCVPGDTLTRFELTAGKTTAAGVKPKAYTFGVVICYEDTEPGLARRYNQWSGDPKPADFLVNMSLDSWFDGTEEHEQHLAVSRFRAVEARRPLLRSVHNGISAVIDGDGRVKELLQDADDWSKSKRAAGTIVTEVPLDGRGSPYAAFGDWVPLLAWVGLVTAFVTLYVARR